MAVPAKNLQVGPILVQVQPKMGQVRRFWCAVPDVFGFLDCGQMREMAAFEGMKSARMSYLAPTTGKKPAGWTDFGASTVKNGAS